MKKQLINEAFRLQTLAGIKPINSLNENDHAYDTLMDAVDDTFEPGTPENEKLAAAVLKALDNSELEVYQYEVPNAHKQVEMIAKEIGLVKENKPSFYSPDYIIQKYGEEKAKEIEDNIHDEEDNNPNIWDLFTSLETPEEVDHFVQGFIDESYDNPKSKLEAVIQQAWKENDINKAKNLVANYIKDSKINNDSKKTILNKMKVITDKEKLDYYLANSLLKFEKMGLNEGENNYVMVTYEGHNIENKVLGKVGQLDIEKYVDNYVNQKKAEYLQDDDSDSEYAEQFFYYEKDDIYGKGEIYHGQVGEDIVFDVFEIPSDVTDIDAWVDSQTR
jgi:hypothetical protein